MSAAFEDIRVDRVKAALTDPAAVSAFESLMEQLDGTIEVAVGAERAAFEMRGELADATGCNICGGSGLDVDVYCGYCIHGWRERALAADLEIASQREREDLLATLLVRAHTRLMVSEGNARYIDNNVALAEEIRAALAALSACKTRKATP